MNKQLNLNANYSLTLEREANIARLVIIKDNIEFVCRKEKVSLIQKFLQQPSAHIFKGRLQLDKFDNTITIMVKGESIAATNVQEFERLLV